ncbi:MAG: DUF285 domain-containing protein [Lactobacillaceae bacterium]|jgi:surface protein|nr:DUF285 domain-containing protein [Lactobacillaceae bacterium]
MQIHKFTKRCIRALMLLAVVVGGAIAPAGTIVVPWVQAEVSADVSGTWGTCDWSVVNNVLTINAGTLADSTEKHSGNCYPWNNGIQGQHYTDVIINGPVYTNTNAVGLFYNMDKITEIVGLKNLHVENTENFADMFYACKKLTSLDLTHFNTSNAKNMSEMFGHCQAATKIDVSSFDTNNVTDMYTMFQSDNALLKVDVSSFDTTNVTNMGGMFSSCYALTKLDLSNFDTSHVTSWDSMFGWDRSLWQLKLGPNFSVMGNLSVNYLEAPTIGTAFDNSRKVTSTKWRSVGAGTVQAPTGPELTVAEIPAYQTADNDKIGYTYVWQGNLGDAIVAYTVQSSYTITIPTSITIASPDEPATGTVTLSANPKLPFNARYINVGTISRNDNAWELTNENDQVGADYTLKCGSDVLSNGTKMKFEADGEQSQAQSKTIAAQMTDANHKFKYAGSYQDIVTFQITTNDGLEHLN